MRAPSAPRQSLELGPVTGISGILELVSFKLYRCLLSEPVPPIPSVVPACDAETVASRHRRNLQA